MKYIAVTRLAISIVRSLVNLFIVTTLEPLHQSSEFFAFLGLSLMIGIGVGAYSQDILVFAQRSTIRILLRYIVLIFPPVIVITLCISNLREVFAVSVIGCGILIGMSHWILGLIRIYSGRLYEICFPSVTLISYSIYAMWGASNESGTFHKLTSSFAISLCLLLIVVTYLYVVVPNQKNQCVQDESILKRKINLRFLFAKYTWEAYYIISTRFLFIFFSIYSGTIEILPYVYLFMELISVLLSQLQNKYLSAKSSSMNITHLNKLFIYYGIVVILFIAMLNCMSIVNDMNLTENLNHYFSLTNILWSSPIIVKNLSSYQTVMQFTSILFLILTIYTSQYIAYLRYAIDLHESLKVTIFFLGMFSLVMSIYLVSDKLNVLNAATAIICLSIILMSNIYIINTKQIRYV